MSLISEHTREGVRMTTAEREDRNSTIISLYAEGYSLSEIGEIFDRSRERIRQILASNGVTLRSRGMTQDQIAARKQQVADMRNTRMQQLRERMEV